MKHPQPDVLIAYNRGMRGEPPPSVCHSCEHYDDEAGFCRVYESEPPESFLYQWGECPSWNERMPF